MRYLDVFPLVVTMPDGTTRKPARMTIGPALTADYTEVDPDGEQTTTLWLWGAARRRGYPLVTTTNEPVPVAGRRDMWDLETDEGTLRLRYKPSASCCGDNMRSWRPPGTGARRRGTT